MHLCDLEIKLNIKDNKCNEKIDILEEKEREIKSLINELNTKIK